MRWWHLSLAKQLRNVQWLCQTSDFIAKLAMSDMVATDAIYHSSCVANWPFLWSLQFISHMWCSCSVDYSTWYCLCSANSLQINDVRSGTAGVGMENKKCQYGFIAIPAPYQNHSHFPSPPLEKCRYAFSRPGEVTVWYGIPSYTVLLRALNGSNIRPEKKCSEHKQFAFWSLVKKFESNFIGVC